MEDLKSLIDKINQEGIQSAENKAREIEGEAQRQAQAIVSKAEKEAKKLLSDARDEIARMEKSGQESLKQAGRNLIISLRKEIGDTLDRLMTLRVRDELTPGDMARIMSSLIKNYKGSGEGKIIISLGKDDLKKMEKSFLAKLKEETKRGITLRQSEDIQGGFVISYDGGRSHYDFTDKALVEHLSLFLKPELSRLLERGPSAEDKKE